MAFCHFWIKVYIKFYRDENVPFLWCLKVDLKYLSGGILPIDDQDDKAKYFCTLSTVHEVNL